LEKRLFGTDGVRGVANHELKGELAFKLGRIGGYFLSQNSKVKRPVVLIGKDTRLSGDMLEAALMAGLTSVGIDFKLKKINLTALFTISSILTAGVILINLNLQTKINSSFFPLQLRENFFQILYSDLPLLVIIFITLLFTASVEQFIFNKVIFSLFDLYLPSFIAVILSALFASLLFLEFNPAFILMIFISVIISNYLYIITDYNLFTSIIFYSYFLTLYIVFIYGFEFMYI
jgi:hypothetical protein